MSTIGVGARRVTKSTDYDAAQALLDLQSNNTQEGNNDPRGWRDPEGKEGLEKAAKLILSCFISTDIANKSDINSSVNRNISHLPFKTSTVVKKNISGCKNAIKSSKTSRNVEISVIANHGLQYYSNSSNNPETKCSTSDAQTQTEEQYFNSNIQIMETTIKNLCDRIKSLEAQLKTSIEQSNDEFSFKTDIIKKDSNSTYEDEDRDPDFEMAKQTDAVNEYQNSQASEFKGSPVNDNRIHQINKNVQYNGVLSNQITNYYDSVPIGYGNATVPSRLLKHINWNSYSSATRKLLTAVFSRRILATHSLTGKPSPAFPNKPAKKRLDPVLINDIVQTVVERCRVPESVVRTSITTKCADESKMLRTREKNKKKRLNKKNRENMLPSSESEDSDNY